MPVLDREEYIEQSWFWRTFLERSADGVPAQDILVQAQEEILATTRLPMALDFLAGEIRHSGRLSDGMQRMRHYFAPFQAYIITRAEDEKCKFDLKVALTILAAEAEYRASEKATPQGLFIYQFECVARNRLGYLDGLQAIAEDAMFDNDWRQWIRRVAQELGTTEFCEFLYRRSQFAVEERRRADRDPEWQPAVPILFGIREGRIAKANRNRDPLYMFAALQRQLGYPAVPRSKSEKSEAAVHPVIARRFELLEKRLQILEQEVKGGIDLEQFYKQREGGQPGPG